MKRITRRKFIQSAAMAAGLAASVPILEACAAAATTPVVIKEKVVETVVVEKVVTKEVPKEVTKVVEKTVVVEKKVEVTATPKTLPPTTLTLWRAPIWVGPIDNVLKSFQSAYPQIKFNVVDVPLAQWYDKTIVAGVPGKGPDLLYWHASMGADLTKQKVNAPIPDSVYTTKQIDELFFSDILASTVVDGKYSLLPGEVNTWGVIYRKDFLEKAGITKPPANYDEFVEAAKATTIWEGGKMVQSGFPFPKGQMIHWYLTLVESLGGHAFSEDGKTMAFDSPEGVEALTTITDLVTKHKVWETTFLDAYPAMQQGKGAMVFGGAWVVTLILPDFPEIKKQCDAMPFTVLLPRVGPQGPRASGQAGWGFGVTKACPPEKQEAAWTFFQFATSESEHIKWILQLKETPLRRALVDMDLWPDLPLIKAYMPTIKYHIWFGPIGAPQVLGEIDNMWGRVLLEGVKPADSVKQAQETINKFMATAEYPSFKVKR